jgi:hypothetical protein
MVTKIPGFLYDENGFIVGKDLEYYRIKSGGAPAPPPDQDSSEDGLRAEDFMEPEEEDEEYQQEEYDEEEPQEYQEDEYQPEEYSDDFEEPIEEDTSDENLFTPDTTPEPEKPFRLRKFPVQEQTEEPKPKPKKIRRIIRYPQQQMMYQQPGMPFIPPPIGADWQPQPQRPFEENPEVTLVHAGMRNVIKNLLGSTNGIYLPGVNAPMLAQRGGGRRSSGRRRRSRR